MKIKRLALIAALAVALAGVGAAQSWYMSQAFLATGVSCGTSASVVNGTDFGSAAVRVSFIGQPSIGALTVTFTRAAGSSTATVDFYFQVSYDGGTTYSDYIEPFSVETGHAAISGTTVRVTKPILLYGVSHIRLYKITNNDGSNALTVCNAAISM